MRPAADIATSSTFAQIRRRAEELRAWREANPEAAAERDRQMREEDARQREAERAEREQSASKRVPAQLRELGVPLDVVDAIAASPTADQRAKDFLAAPELFWILLGTPGPGKTHLASWALALTLARDGSIQRASGSEGRRPEPAMFVLALTFARMSAYDSADKEWFERCCRARVLVLDDLSKEMMGRVANDYLRELITRRHGARLKTIITSNLDTPKMRAVLSVSDDGQGALYDRMASSRFEAPAMTGPSRRVRPAKPARQAREDCPQHGVPAMRRAGACDCPR